MKLLGIGIAMAMASAIPALASGISFTCDSSIGADFDPGGSGTSVCTYLKGTIAGLYNSTFTNANASIYIQAGNSGLAGSGQYTNLIPYDAYQSLLEAESTDPAKATVPATEPSIFGGGGDVGLTSALAQALGGITGITGTTAAGAQCLNPGSAGCYNGIITVIDPTDLKMQRNEGFTYETLGGSTTAATGGNYDFFALVEHEVDEVLGTSSCIDLTASGTTNACSGNPMAADLFRYSGSGVRAYDLQSPTDQYFSANGGVTDLFNNLYNTTTAGEDWADFSQGCVFVQDAEGCRSLDPSTNSYSILTDGPGGTVGPEVAILNAVGYDLIPAPEPGTMGLLALGTVALGFAVYRRGLA